MFRRTVQRAWIYTGGRSRQVRRPTEALVRPADQARRVEPFGVGADDGLFRSRGTLDG